MKTEFKKEKEFDKYKKRGSLHWREMKSKDPRVFNAYQQARYDWILKIAGDVKGKRVLDLGCGDGSLTYLLCKKGAIVTGVDNNELGLKYAQKNIESVDSDRKLKYSFVNASVDELPFDAESFDLVVSCEVIEHLPEPDGMLSESARVLRSGGKLVLTTPYKLTEVPADLNHVREFYPGELQNMLEQHFSDVAVKPTHHIMWRGLYSYTFRWARNRPLGRWLINIPVLLFGWNPFMFDYDPPAKLDAFSSICAWGSVRTQLGIESQ